MRAFVFTLFSFFLLFFFLNYYFAYREMLNAYEQTFIQENEFAKVRSVIEHLSKENMKKFLDASITYALAKLSLHTMMCPIKEEYNETDLLKFIKEIVENGSSNEVKFITVRENLKSNCDFSYNEEERKSSTIAGFMENTKGVLHELGFENVSFKIELENITQKDWKGISYKARVKIDIKDEEMGISYSDEYEIEGYISFERFPDPLIGRETLLMNCSGSYCFDEPIYKLVRFHPEAETLQNLSKYHEKKYSSTGWEKKMSDVYGMGWFYGPVVNTSNAIKIPRYERPFWILVGKYEDIISLNNESINWTEFGAYILTNKQKEENLTVNGETYHCYNETFNGFCWNDSGSIKGFYEDIVEESKKNQSYKIDKPFIVLKYFEIGNQFSWEKGHHRLQAYGPNHSIFLINFTGIPEGEKRLMFITNTSVKDGSDIPGVVDSSNATIYGLEFLRDAIVCGYYFNDKDAPSFLQRMFVDGINRTSKNGMVTFVVGSWAGGRDTPEYQNYSRLDIKFFKKEQGYKVLGFPGCKNKEMCTDENNILGAFTLDEDTAKKLGVSSLLCKGDIEWACQ